jgi:hypothetical protein
MRRHGCDLPSGVATCLDSIGVLRSLANRCGQLPAISGGKRGQQHSPGAWTDASLSTVAVGAAASACFLRIYAWSSGALGKGSESERPGRADRAAAQSSTPRPRRMLAEGGGRSRRRAVSP